MATKPRATHGRIDLVYAVGSRKVHVDVKRLSGHRRWEWLVMDSAGHVFRHGQAGTCDVALAAALENIESVAKKALDAE